MATVDGRERRRARARRRAPGEHNRPLTDLFEPGSTNKLITLSTALEHGHRRRPTPMFNVPATIRVGDTSYTDVDPHRVNGTEHWSTTDILRESSNVGTIEIAQHLGEGRSSPSALRAFGLGQTTAVDFPGQARACCSIPTSTTTTGLASSAIGYGVAVTGDADARRVHDDRQRRRDACRRASLDATIDAHGERHDAPLAPADARGLASRPRRR